MGSYKTTYLSIVADSRFMTIATRGEYWTPQRRDSQLGARSELMDMNSVHEIRPIGIVDSPLTETIGQGGRNTGSGSR